MISDFSQRVEVKRISLTADFGFGEPRQSEPSVFTTWAAITEISRKDALRQGLDADNVQYKMRIRYVASRVIQKRDIILWNGVQYQPRTAPQVIEIDKKKFLELIIVVQNGDED